MSADNRFWRASKREAMAERPDRIVFGDKLSASRMICGLWQVADLEKDGATLDPEKAADALEAYARAGFDTFDMADHYGSAELIAGRLLARHDVGSRPVALTKWCPAPGPMTPEVVRRGVQERLDRLGVEQIDLLQFHWWRFEHPAWLDALHELGRLKKEGLIKSIGVTNFDAAHLALALADGVPIVSNQVSFSLIDRRAAGGLSNLCRCAGVKLLAYGTLCGGFLSDAWLNRPEPESLPDWSRSKYKRFIDSAGGWPSLQTILSAAENVAKKHGVSIANVAARWVLEHEAVAAIIVGARITEREHRADNLAMFDFVLDDDDRNVLNQAFGATKSIPGDCGDEYRRPPYLTASGDLSHHLDAAPLVYKAEPAQGRSDRFRVSSGSVWEPIAGYSRAVRVKDRILVSGTTATHGANRCVAPNDAGAQTTYILDKIAASIEALGGTMADVVRTRVYLRDVTKWEPVSRAHGRVFAGILPANTLLQAGALVGDYEVEIEAEAVVQA
jgi:aryl-alcohol dehydrogenase-like predicted oxidoreductase/enamine deaminase RidA (YjgF/YER057c/UK114 family)